LHIPVAARWFDLDAFQHVNNVAVFRLLEEARIVAFWQLPPGDTGPQSPLAFLATGPDATQRTLVAAHRIEYLRAIPFTRIPLRIELWLGRVQGASIEVCYEVCAGRTGDVMQAGPASGAEPYAVATSILVPVDARAGNPVRITDAQREAFAPFIEPPPTFRR
jgi:acyl-CoA thioester hydrolase